MNHITLFPGTKPYRKMKKLYLTAFPPKEQQPFFRLWLLSILRPQVHLWGYMDGKELVSFKFFIVSGRYVYSMFTAVEPALRSKGYGSKMLSDLKTRFPNRDIIFEIERPEETAENHAQRLRRLAFFQKNGFFTLDRTISHQGITFTLMSTSQDYDREAYLGCFRHLSLRPISLIKNLISRMVAKIH